MTDGEPRTGPRAAGCADVPGSRYLRYEPPQREAGGMNHWLSNMQCLMREALELGRAAVLPSLGLARRHNFGVAADWRWETYFDMRAGRLVDAGGNVARPLPMAARVPERPATVLRLASGEAVPARGAACEMVVRQVGPLYREHVPQKTLPCVALWLPPSPAVVALARPVVERLTSSGAGYVAVHVRRGERMRARRRWREGTSPEGILRKLGRHGVGPDVSVFVLSDELDPAFWAALRGRCRLFRYTDFPQLAAVVARTAPLSPDNYLLYEAETEVMRHARLRIGTIPGLGRVQADDYLLEADVMGDGELVRRAADVLSYWSRRFGRRGW